jgi:crotonobetainyl-CoA:carnitine CoA-transferase CaiB-like acyl-CoA transferase
LLAGCGPCPRAATRANLTPLPLHRSRLLSATDPPPASLAGLRVLDLSRVLAGPLCTMILGDLGADVIKVERPGGGDDTRQWGPPWAGPTAGRESAYFLALNRNKRSVVAELKTEAGRDLVRSLSREADVLVENFVAGTLEGWGLGYDELKAENPGIVYCSITGYGSEGPMAARPGYDFAVQAETGWMAVTGEPGGEPMKAGVAVVDVLTGQNAAIAILAALREREVSGRGQRVEVALYDSALAGLVNVAQAALIGAPTARHGNAHPNIVPYQAFAAADRPLAVAVGNDAQWRRFCPALGLSDLAEDARFATNPLRVENRAALVPILAGRVAERPAAEWIELLEEAGVPCSLVRSVTEAAADESFRLRGGVWAMVGAGYGAVETVASPLRLSRTPARLDRPAPAAGEHTEEVERDGWGTGGEA